MALLQKSATPFSFDTNKSSALISHSRRSAVVRVERFPSLIQDLAKNVDKASLHQLF
jgi:hypothetical protein